MADDFKATLFAEARTHHDSACRWFGIAVAILAVFHVMLYRPYVDLTARNAEAASALAHDSALKKSLEDMRPDLARLSALSADAAKQRLDDLLADLRATFSRLNDIVGELRELGPERASGEPGARLFAATAGASMAVQMSVPIANAAVSAGRGPEEAGPDVPTMSDALRRDIAGATSQRAMLDRIKPYIDDEIIAPRFARFNEAWRSEIAPQVATVGNALRQRIQVVAQRFPDQAPSWTSLDPAVSGVMAAAGAFKIAAPSESLWWSQAKGKGATFQGFLRPLDAPILQRAALLADLEQKTEAAIATTKKQQAEIEAQIARLNEDFKEQKKELAALVEPLKAVFVDLATIVAYFPALLAIGLIALTVWLASRLRELGEAVALFEGGEVAGGAREWLRRCVIASLWHSPESVIARGVAFALWVAFAAWELAGASTASRLAGAVLGVAGIAVASRYELRVARTIAAPPSGG